METFMKSGYLRVIEGANIIKVKVDLLAIDPEKPQGNVVMMSSVDAPAKLDKMRVDYKKATLKQAYFADNKYNNILMQIAREQDMRFSTYVADFRGTDLNILKTKVGKLSHLLMTQKNNSEYIYKFNNEDSVVDLIMNKLINIYFIPCKSDNVQEVLLTNPDVLKPVIVITDNDKLKHIKVFSFNKDLFIETLNKLSVERGETPDPIFNDFIGDFTGYINRFKSEILENLYSKIDEFFDKDNVPEYVTTYPYPLPNKDLKNLLETFSQKSYNVSLSELSTEDKMKIYEHYKKLDKQNLINRTKDFNPDWSRQYVVWTAAMKMLETEKFAYLSTIMGSGRHYCVLN